MISTSKKILGSAALATIALTSAGCTRDWKSQPVSMWNESRYKPYEATTFFRDNNTSRPTVPGTVARGQLRTDEAFFNGTQNGTLVTTFPYPVTEKVLERGRQRFNIYCTPCHGEQGAGNGMIVQRGFSKPPDYIEPRLVAAPVGHFYDVITNGYGSMYSYSARVSPRDRWAIAAYIRVLQRSRGASIADVPAAKRAELNTPLKPSVENLPAGSPLSAGAISSGASSTGSLDLARPGDREAPGVNGNSPASPADQAAPRAPETTNQRSVSPKSQSPATQPAPGAGDNAGGDLSGHDKQNPAERE